MLIYANPRRSTGVGRYLETLFYPRRSRGLGVDPLMPIFVDAPVPPDSLPGVVPYLPMPQSTLPPIWTAGPQVTAVPPDISAPSTPINIGSGAVNVPPPTGYGTLSPTGQVVPAAGYAVNAKGQIVPVATSLSAWLAGSMIPGVTNQTLAVLGGGGMLLALVFSKRKGRR